MAAAVNIETLVDFYNARFIIGISPQQKTDLITSSKQIHRIGVAAIAGGRPIFCLLFVCSTDNLSFQVQLRYVSDRPELLNAVSQRPETPIFV